MERLQEGERDMVLANVVKVAFGALAGAALFGVVSYYALALFARWYGPRYIHSDSDINDVYLPMLIIQLVLPVAGVYLGYRWARKKPQ